ncbi:hypothetical protein ABT56_11660 [Photobacterium aquae]|uniref:DUF1318 domain-containing protein n=1 Tax=Photobacterium aquae TaxID=1195763 RepID=A0A0J1H0L6_9GAMM|nr:YdbL family protein [Photobacterium aquae]KLV05370.1 hypothetical protein ABT56_11660 [Photobacterium aquae]
MKKCLLAVIALLISFHAYALNLQQAKDRGLVGETNTGLIAPVTSQPSNEVRKLVADVNKHRNEQYKKIAVSHGLSVKEVGHLAHKRAIEKTASGHYYQDASGKWLRK